MPEMMPVAWHPQATSGTRMDATMRFVAQPCGVRVRSNPLASINERPANTGLSRSSWQLRGDPTPHEVAARKLLSALETTWSPDMFAASGDEVEAYLVLGATAQVSVCSGHIARTRLETARRRPSRFACCAKSWPEHSGSGCPPTRMSANCAVGRTTIGTTASC